MLFKNKAELMGSLIFIITNENNWEETFYKYFNSDYENVILWLKYKLGEIAETGKTILEDENNSRMILSIEKDNDVVNWELSPEPEPTKKGAILLVG